MDITVVLDVMLCILAEVYCLNNIRFQVCHKFGVTDFDIFPLSCTYLACCLVCLDSEEPVSCVW
jgi:hypothetical protein